MIQIERDRESNINWDFNYQLKFCKNRSLIWCGSKILGHRFESHPLIILSEIIRIKYEINLSFLFS